MAELLQVKRLSEHAVLPSRGSVFAAGKVSAHMNLELAFTQINISLVIIGLDLSSAYDTVVPARGKVLVKTDLSIAIPENTYARIAPRSGLALKHSIDVGAGVIDYDYRGPVCVILFNHGDSDFAISRGDRIAQLILERISMASVVEVEELSETIRGAGGFGSSGVAAPVQVGSNATENDVKKPRNV